MKILIVEDEEELANDVVEYLSTEQYVSETAHNYIQALDKIGSYQYDCIILDLMLPDGNGLKLLEYIRKENRDAGVIIVSAKNSLEDKITGLHTGADDYLSKPFHHSELSARVHSIIRRKQFGNANIIEKNELRVDLLAKTVHVDKTPVVLTKKEFDLLLLFLGNSNKVISKSALAEHLSGDIADMFDNHDFVYAHVKNLKKKLTEGGCRPYLKTIYGVGYKWEA